MQSPSIRQIFWVFLTLGCSAFGGPAAHLVFFHRTLVQNRQWLSDTDYAQILALTQLLPGPSSSQAGIAIGYHSKGYAGGFVAWLGFTLPSALLMYLFALSIGHWHFNMNAPIIHHIFTMVLGIVCFACWQMLRSYCQQGWQYLLMLASCLAVTFAPVPGMQMLVILIAAGIGLIFSASIHRHTATQPNQTTQFPPTGTTAQILRQPARQTTRPIDSMSRAYLWLLLLVVIFILLFIFKQMHASVVSQSIYDFYSTGSLVFGGGHVVLPLLYQNFVVTDVIDRQLFELGYAFVQLMPGPLFTFSAYLGALLPSGLPPVIGAGLAVIFIFLPSFLLVFGSLPYWSFFLNNPRFFNAVTAINAAVVGFLVAMIIPMASTSLLNWLDLICLITFISCLYFKLSLLVSVPLTLFITCLLEWII
ncbi:chromate efflux transporter [Acinetobacter sp. WZC-1]|uniref:chromate efflux transporter n=1 Tax=Acinetobacter sp. WZC-1 TaxID=3459034 RepID=UPI00403E13F1